MDRRQLQIFRQVAHSESFTRAAEVLHMAQPAVSIAVRKLEQELDSLLFNRVDRRISLTEAGRALLVRAEHILAEFKLAQDELRDMQALKTGQVRLDTPAMLGSYYFPQKIAAFRQEYPDIDLRITAEGTQRAEQMLLDGTTELAIINVEEHSELIESRYLIKEEVVLCMAPTHPLASETYIDAGQLKMQPLIVYHQGYHLRKILNYLVSSAEVEPEIILETDILRLMVNMVSAGLGVSLCLKRLVDAEEGVVGRPFSDPQNIELGIGWKRGGYLSRANQAFVDFLIQQRAPN